MLSFGHMPLIRLPHRIKTLRPGLLGLQSPAPETSLAEQRLCQAFIQLSSQSFLSWVLLPGMSALSLLPFGMSESCISFEEGLAQGVITLANIQLALSYVPAPALCSLHLSS